MWGTLYLSEIGNNSNNRESDRGHWLTRIIFNASLHNREMHLNYNQKRHFRANYVFLYQYGRSTYLTFFTRKYFCVWKKLLFLWHLLKMRPRSSNTQKRKGEFFFLFSFIQNSLVSPKVQSYQWGPSSYSHPHKNRLFLQKI